MHVVNNVTGDTTMLASFGNPNKGNLGPAAYNAAFEVMGVDYIYLALEPRDIGEAIAGVRSLGLGGGTITKPFKQDVIAYLDEIDDDAKNIGAVNVVVNNEGKLVGHNSDWIGAMNALQARSKIQGKRVALLGAGGAARALAFGLQKNNASTVLFNRTQETGEEVSAQFNCEFGGDLSDVDDAFDIIINATTVGFGKQEGEVPVNDAALSKHPLVFDIVPRPAPTTFIKHAHSLGCETIPGALMVAHQAVYALEWLTGVTPPLDVLLKHFSS